MGYLLLSKNRKMVHWRRLGRRRIHLRCVVWKVTDASIDRLERRLFGNCRNSCEWWNKCGWRSAGACKVTKYRSMGRPGSMLRYYAQGVEQYLQQSRRSEVLLVEDRKCCDSEKDS